MAVKAHIDPCFTLIPGFLIAPFHACVLLIGAHELSDARVINADGRLFLVIINSICPVPYHAHVTHHTNQTKA
jgi:hypothetical protein